VDLPWLSFLLGLLLIALVLAFAYSGYVIYHWTRTTVASVPESAIPLITAVAAEATNAARGVTPTPAVTPSPTPSQQSWHPRRGERVNILLLGVDKRPGEFGPTRTDTMIVVTLDPASGQVGMLSIPRDLWVPIPEYDIFAKINTAHVIGEKRGYPGGGAALAKRTVSDLIGYPIHYYVKINFDGFRRLIDLIGGIDIYVPQDINDPTFPDDNYGYDPLYIPAGQHHMDGELALKYARTRHVDDDYGRARRQQQVLLAIKDRITRTDMLPSLIMRLPQLARTFAGSVETDIPIDKAIALANLARHLDLDRVKQVVIDRSLGEERNDPEIGYVLIPNREALRPLMDELFGDAQQAREETSSYSAAMAASPVQKDWLTAESARIAVLDGTNQPERAARAAEWLRSLGFQITHVGQADKDAYPRTMVRVFIRKPHTLSQLQGLLGDVEVRDLSHTVSMPPWDMEIVLGEDFTLPTDVP